MKQTTKLITTSAIMAALVFVLTILVRVPVPALNGQAYFNLGDTMIYFAAYVLGGMPAMFAAGIGSFLADLSVGAVVYAIPTLIIKGFMGFLCGYMMKKGNFRMYLLACIIGGAIMTFGYALFEYFAFDVAYVLVSLPANCIQWACGAGVALVLYKVAKKTKSMLSLERSRCS